MSDASPTRLDIDPPFYRGRYADLHELTDDQLAQHYHLFGEEEGRQANPMGFANVFFSSVKPDEDVLEIGPYLSPGMRGDRVKYFEILDSDGLIARAASIGHHNIPVPRIDYVSPAGDLAIVEDNMFDVVFSCHCIEHVPDLIRHLNHVDRILRPGGRFMVMIPDKRYCFDHHVSTSTIADVVQAWHERRVAPNLANFVQGYALATHNDTKRHWAGDHGTQKVFEDPGIVSESIQKYEETTESYTDLHVWRFTPRSFREITTQLLSAQLTRLRPDVVVGTSKDSNTFFAILRPDPQRS